MADPSTYPNLNPNSTLNGSIQGVKDAIANGPVAESVKVEAAKTSSEFQNLVNARTPPDQPAATGQPLTHYHSMFYNLLSWENPRATAITFGATIVFIFMARYLNILRYLFKAVYFTLGITATAELAGKMLFDHGFASRIRPRKYYVIPREALERSLGDVEQLINFFVIESQRIIFAENVTITTTAFVAAVAAYWLIKFVPFWGLCLIGTCAVYLGPLIYVKNREAIDSQLQQVGNIVNSQAAQIKDMTAQHASRATESVKSYAGEYTSMAQEYIGAARKPSPSPTNTTTTSSPAVKMEDATTAPSADISSSFPTAPKQEPEVVANSVAEPVVAQ